MVSISIEATKSITLILSIFVILTNFSIDDPDKFSSYFGEYLLKLEVIWVLRFNDCCHWLLFHVSEILSGRI